MRFGISSYAFGWAIGFGDYHPEMPMNEYGLLRQAVAHRANAIQIADNLPLENFSSERLERLSREARAAGVQIEVGAKKLTRDRLMQYATIAKELGSPFVRFVIDDQNYRPSVEEIRRIIAECLPMIDDVVLAIENHDRLTSTQLRNLLEEIDSPQVGICLDTANSLGAGEGLETVLTQLGPWTVNVHVKDIAIRRIDTMMGFHVEGRPAGEGQLNIPGLLDSLNEFGRCQSATLELWTPREETLAKTIEKEFAWAARSCDYLKPLIDKA